MPDPINDRQYPELVDEDPANYPTVLKNFSSPVVKDNPTTTNQVEETNGTDAVPSVDPQSILTPQANGWTIPRLLAELDRLFPEESPQINESERKLVWRGGQRSVVRFIESLVNE